MTRKNFLILQLRKPTKYKINIFFMQEQWPIFNDGGVQKLCDEYSIPFLGTIPLDPVSS